jgi:hypothetical protein
MGREREKRRTRDFLLHCGFLAAAASASAVTTGKVTMKKFFSGADPVAAKC